MPLFIASWLFLLYLGYHKGRTGLETIAWLKEAGLTLTSHVRRLQINFGVTWLDESHTTLTPSYTKSATLIIDIAVLHIEVSRESNLELSLAYNTKVE